MITPLQELKLRGIVHKINVGDLPNKIDGNKIEDMAERYVAYSKWQDNEAVNIIKKFIKTLTPSKHETIDQWEKRIGKEFLSSSPVWVYECTGTLAKTYDWVLRDYRYSCINGCEKVLVADLYNGKPEKEKS